MTTRPFRQSPSGVAGCAIVLLVIGVAVLSIEFRRPRADPGSPSLSLLTRYFLEYGPHEEDRSISAPPTAPDSRHLLGTDIQRRDILARLLHGTRISIQVGLCAELIALSIGLLVGAVAAYYGGWIDSALMRAADILLAFPLPILAMAAIAVFDTRSITLVFVVLGLMGWPSLARLVRSQCLSVRAHGYPEAARALGARDSRLILRHLLPNASAPALVAASVGVAGNILTEAWLSFLGLGVQGTTISWGRMIVDGQPDLALRPWLSVFPGLALAFTVLGFVLLADGLRDALDPKVRLATHTS